ncbi:phage portal protein [Brevundimonas sp. 3P9-tot-E]|uniref:phage portal protein n=1 Tax=unclassified Brevundimonas TaxID=2622653 RepID=UPI0039A2334F
MLDKALSLIGLQRKSLSDPSVELLSLFGATPTASGVAVSADSAMTCGPAYACVRLLADTVAGLPLHTFKRIEGGKDRDHGPLDILLNDQASPWMSAFELRAAVMADALRHDKGGFAAVVRVAGTAEELHYLRSEHVTVEYDRLTGEPTYKVSQGDGITRVWPREDMLHIRIGPKAPLSAAREAIGISIVLERHASRLFSRGAKPSGVLTVPKGLSAEALARARDMWNASHSGEGAGGTAFTEDGFTWTPHMLTSVDAQFLELRLHQVVEICRAFSVPPPLAQDLGRATWSNAESLFQQFLTLSLLPLLKLWEGAIRRTLIAPKDRSSLVVEHVVDGLVRADLAARYSAFATAINTGFLNPNEARAMDNRAPYIGGDEFRRPMNTEAPMRGQPADPVARQ